MGGGRRGGRGGGGSTPFMPFLPQIPDPFVTLYLSKTPYRLFQRLYAFSPANPRSFCYFSFACVYEYTPVHAAKRTEPRSSWMRAPADNSVTPMTNQARFWVAAVVLLLSVSGAVGSTLWYLGSPLNRSRNRSASSYMENPYRLMARDGTGRFQSFTGKRSYLAAEAITQRLHFPRKLATSRLASSATTISMLLMPSASLLCSIGATISIF